MTASELKAKVEQVEPYFFDRKTMSFFGDRMSNYGVRSATIDTWTENSVDVWELYRRRPVRHGLTSSAYFRKDNFKKEFTKK